MATTKPRILLRLEYEQAARDYCDSLPLEYFIESFAQSTQRKITVESLDLVSTKRPDMQVFSKLLIQYPFARRRRPTQVVPDNMVVLWKEPIKVDGSFALPFQPCGPFWVLEYVSKGNKRKDYEDNMQKYEKELKVLYYLLFCPDEQELTLYHLKGRRYVSVLPNEQERYAIPELELEMVIVGEWVRYWYQGKLLPLPGELQRELEESLQKTAEANRRADEATRRAEVAEQENARLREQVEQLRRRKNGS